MTSILTVYRSCPMMIVIETEEGVLLELSLNELADVYELLPPALWQELVHHYHIFHVALPMPLIKISQSLARYCHIGSTLRLTSWRGAVIVRYMRRAGDKGQGPHQAARRGG
jgi:hypothetical protein